MEYDKVISPMRVIFRVEANEHIGIGHAMRCVSIAEELCDRGHEIYLLTGNETAVHLFQKYIGNFQTVMLKSQSIEEVHDKISAIFGVENGIVVVDQYHLPNDYFNRIKSDHRHKLVYIDDWVSLFDGVDLFVNPVLMDRSEDYKTNGKRALSGVSYLCIRKEIRESRKMNAAQSIKNVFLTSGGTDVNHTLYKIADVLAKNTNWKIQILIGPSFTDLASYQTLASTYSNIELVSNMEKIVENFSYIKFKTLEAIYAEADISFSSLGTSCYEMLYKRLPMCGFTVVDNQLENFEMLVANQLILPLCEGHNFLEKDITKAVKSLELYDVRQKIFEMSGKLVDGLGVERIVNALEGLNNE